jgi:hypothetical protein
MIRRGRKRLGATRDSLRPQAGVGKETLGGCRECHGETPRHERLFEVTEVGADVRFVERDGLHRRRRFMSDVGGRAGAARTFSEVWPFADLILQTKVRSARQVPPFLQVRFSAGLRHADRARRCPFPGEDRKSPVLCQSDAIDPSRTSMCVELLNLIVSTAASRTKLAPNHRGTAGVAFWPRCRVLTRG